MATESNVSELLLALSWEQVRDVDTALRERVWLNTDNDNPEFREHLLEVIAKLEPLYRTGAVR